MTSKIDQISVHYNTYTGVVWHISSVDAGEHVIGYKVVVLGHDNATAES